MPAVLRDYAEPYPRPRGLDFWRGALIAAAVGALAWDFLIGFMVALG